MHFRGIPEYDLTSGSGIFFDGLHQSRVITRVPPRASAGHQLPLQRNRVQSVIWLLFRIRIRGSFSSPTVMFFVSSVLLRSFSVRESSRVLCLRSSPCKMKEGGFAFRLKPESLWVFSTKEVRKWRRVQKEGGARRQRHADRCWSLRATWRRPTSRCGSARSPARCTAAYIDRCALPDDQIEHTVFISFYFCDRFPIQLLSHFL